jgi:peptidoglycan hydrolase-like protein with peptidoglycan-binding domain
MDETQKCFLMKYDDGSVFGPIPFEQLRQWAQDAQVSPLDKVSTDEQTWIKAPMVPGLEMDYLVEVTPDQYYGPTTLSAVREFLEAGEINQDTQVTNCKDGTIRVVSDIPELQPAKDESAGSVPVRASIRFNLQQRIRELEEALMEERRARETAETLVEKLEAKLEHVTRAASL